MSSRLRTHFERLAESADIRIDGDRPWDIRVHDERMFQRVLAHGTLGLGEAYMDGWWDCDALDELVRQRPDLRPAAPAASPTTIAARRPGQGHQPAVDAGAPSRSASATTTSATTSTGGCSTARMIYSCGYWREAATLDAAQEAKLTLIANKLGLEPGMRVLDIGCGWGGAAQFFAEQARLRGGRRHRVARAGRPRPRAVRRAAGRDPACRTTASSTSRSTGCTRSACSSTSVSRTTRPTWTSCGAACATATDSSLLHTIGGLRSQSIRPTRGSRSTSSPTRCCRRWPRSRRAAEGRLVIEDVHNFGADYDPTLMAWKANIDAHWDELGEPTTIVSSACGTGTCCRRPAASGPASCSCGSS